MKSLSRFYSVLVMFFLYAPILVLIVYSFNASNSTSVFGGFSMHWYEELFRDKSTLNALSNTLVLAILSSLFATVLGTAAAVGISKLKGKYTRGGVMTVTNLPMMNPDIVTGISMMLLFVFVGTMLGLETKLSFWTLLIAHTTFSLPYVILSVLPKINQMDKHLAEAALDLGCTPLQSFFKVELPAIMPGIFTGLILTFTLSIDDFVISYFTVGGGFETLPIRIYSMTKKKVTPDMYALSTLIFIVILLLLILSNVAQSRFEKRNQKPKKPTHPREIVDQ